MLPMQNNDFLITLAFVYFDIRLHYKGSDSAVHRDAPCITADIINAFKITQFQHIPTEKILYLL